LAGLTRRTENEMILYVELWKSKPAWRALDRAAREQFVAGLGPAIAELTGAGVELLGFACNDGDTPHRADYEWMALWRIPTAELARVFEEAVERSGFHDLFEQVNARGPLVAPEVALTDMVRR
jgi:hypothetical protein